MIAATRVNPGRAHIALRICRANTNLANAIWNDEGRVRWVDWEYSGWGDPALQLRARLIQFIERAERTHTT